MIFCLCFIAIVIDYVCHNLKKVFLLFIGLGSTTKGETSCDNGTEGRRIASRLLVRGLWKFPQQRGSCRCFGLRQRGRQDVRLTQQHPQMGDQLEARRLRGRIRQTRHTNEQARSHHSAG